MRTRFPFTTFCDRYTVNIDDETETKYCSQLTAFVPVKLGNMKVHFTDTLQCSESLSTALVYHSP